MLFNRQNDQTLQWQEQNFINAFCFYCKTFSNKNKTLLRLLYSMATKIFLPGKTSQEGNEKIFDIDET